MKTNGIENFIFKLEFNKKHLLKLSGKDVQQMVSKDEGFIVARFPFKNAGKKWLKQQIVIFYLTSNYGARTTLVYKTCLVIGASNLNEDF